MSCQIDNILAHGEGFKYDSMREIQIIYLPGYGGNFLEALLSLDPSTKPCRALDDLPDTPENRVYCYINRPQDTDLRHWGDLISKDSQLVYPKNVRCMHPGEFSFASHDKKDLIVAELSWGNFSNYWLMKTKENLKFSLARLRDGDIDIQTRIKKKYDPIIISVDAFLDPLTWMDEYVRISDLLELNWYPVAERLYQSWFDLRVAGLKQAFESADRKTLVSVCRARLLENVYGPPSDWNLFYENIRDPSWPNCKTEADFHKLPSKIKKEMIDTFGYVPSSTVEH